MPEFLWSSDSSLSDVPSDVSSIRFGSRPPSPQTCLRIDSPPKTSTTAPETPRSLALHPSPQPTRFVRNKRPKISPYFSQLSSGIESCLPFPPISEPSFGLIQEQLADEPFRLLIATIFLNRTRGGVAIPVLFHFFDAYPTIEILADAELPDVIAVIRCLGFQNQRARKCIELAKSWLATPPSKGRRCRKLHYPKKGDGRDVGRGECINDEDPRSAWEIAHLPGVGAYAIDSWRIFCRDRLRGLAMDWKGAQAKEGFTPEWKSLMPMDKELRAYLTWMWLKEGWVWNPEAGTRQRASEKAICAARQGGLAHEEKGHWVLEPSPIKVMNGLHSVR